MSALTRRAAARRGLTLLELLIVVGIALAITAIAIPVLIPSQNERRMYEAGREITSMFSGARAKAIETGRPVGVMLHRLEGLNYDSTTPVGVATATLSYAEVPPPFSGGFVNGRIHVRPELFTDTNANGVIDSGEWTDENGDGFYTTGLVVAMTDATGTTPDESWRLLVRVGDAMKLNYQGHLYSINSADIDADGYIQSFPWTLGTETAPYMPTTPLPVDLNGDGVLDVGGLPFQIIRQPIVSAGTSVQLPETVLVDLTSSGSDALFFAPNALGIPPMLVGDTITVLYTPGGTIGSIHWGNNYLRPTTSLYLLLCRREQLPPPDGSDPTLLPAWRDLTNRWIGVNVASGQVSTSENFPVDVLAGDDVMDARHLAREAQSSLSRSP